MRFTLIPVCDTGIIILPFKKAVRAAGAGTDLLYSNLQVVCKQDRVGHMPAIETAHGRDVTLKVLGMA